MRLSTLTDRLDERLETDAYADIDASANGLQVGPDEGTVDHVAFAVDAAAATIEAAADAGADLLVTHHGLVWGGLDRVTGREYENVSALVENDLSLYVSHLPLDGHQELGNAAGLADYLGLDALEKLDFVFGVDRDDSTISDRDGLVRFVGVGQRVYLGVREDSVRRLCHIGWGFGTGIKPVARPASAPGPHRRWDGNP